MLITIQFNKDSQIEVELTPDPVDADTPWCDHWLVTRLKVLPSGRTVRLDSGGGSCNTAALYHIFQLFKNQCERTAEESHRRSMQCQLGFPWQCPANFICLNPRNWRDLVCIKRTFHRPKTIELTIQLSLFETVPIHRLVWEDIRTGQICKDEEQPYAYTITRCCQQMAVPIIKWYEKDGFRPYLWKVLPLAAPHAKHPERSRWHPAARQWADQMARQYEGQIPPCTFSSL